MRNVWYIIRDDFRLILSNAISIVVLVGLIAVPGMYAWFNIAGAWDPYKSVDNLEIGVVNEDIGYNSEILPFDINLGNIMVSSLNENGGFKWVFNDKNTSMRKLIDGELYAVIVIPQDFTSQLFSIFEDEVKSANLIYYSNEKLNPLAPKITGKGATVVQQKINNMFSKTLYSVLLNTISDLLSPESVASGKNISNAVVSSLEGINGSIQNLISQMNAIKTTTSTLNEIVADIRNNIPGTDNISTSEFIEILNNIDLSLAQAENSFREVSSVLSSLSIGTQYIDSMAEVFSSLRSSVSRAHGIVDGVVDTSISLNKTFDSVNELVDGIDVQLDRMIGDFSIISGDLVSAKNNINELSSSADTDTIRNILGEDTDHMAELISAPVELDRHAIYSMPNNGSAMSPFYISICLWVGCLLIVTTVSVHLTKRRQIKYSAYSKVKNWQIYLGRYALYFVLSFVQASFICLGCLLFLQIQCVNPLLFMVIAWVVSFTFSLLIYTLVASFGSIGKALAVILLVLQIAAAGGTFPVQMLSETFNWLYEYLPVYYAMKAFSMCIAGFGGFELVYSLLILVLTIVPFSLILGLVLRNPILKVNEKFLDLVRPANLLGI